ncbi:MAG: glycosyltransferase [Cyanobacteriota bacterium]
MFFIVSTGRSGTTTIAKTLSLVNGCVCLHEPPPELIGESSAYRYGVIKGEEIKKILLKTRNLTINNSIYGESNQTLSLIIPVLVEAFPEAKYIWLIRNGLDVVASTYQKQWYTGHSENHDHYEECSPIEQAWIDGRIEGDRCGDMSPDEWSKLDRFGRCCWYWSYVNRIIEADLNEHAAERFKILHLEEINLKLPEIIDWIGLKTAVIPQAERHNVAKREPYHWTRWTEQERATFDHWCGNLMDRFYPTWRTTTEEWKGIEYFESIGVHSFPSLKENFLKISVYITSYNQKKYLIEAIESVLVQTLPPSQVIIVDDCSSDGSQEVIAAYASRYPERITPIYHTCNQGIAQTRIDALQAVTGDYVTYVDGDDRYLPTKLEKEAKLLQQNPNAQIAFSNNYYMTVDGTHFGVWAEGEVPPHGEVFCQTFAREFPKRNLFRMELMPYAALKKIGFHDPKLNLYEDFDIRIRLSKQYRTIYYNEPLSESRIHNKGLSSSDAAQHLAALQYIYRKNKPLLKDINVKKRKEVQQKLEEWIADIAKRAAEEAIEDIQGKRSKKQALKYYFQFLKYKPNELDYKFILKIISQALMSKH